MVQLTLWGGAPYSVAMERIGARPKAAPLTNRQLTILLLRLLEALCGEDSDQKLLYLYNTHKPLLESLLRRDEED
jgi:hypothetical protein